MTTNTMAAATELKASDKQAICRKLVTVLKKRYKSPVPNTSRPTLETILFAACLEDTSPDAAEARFDRLTEDYHDLNEIRVSSISELRRVFAGMPEPEKRAMRIRSTLQYVFEKNFEFDFEAIRRKTFDAAQRQLGKIKGLSPFVLSYSLQAALGSHVVPVDQSMCDALIWLGLVKADATPAQTSEALKPVLRKSDAPLFCHLLRWLSTDPKLQKNFTTAAKHEPEGGYDAASSPERLTQLFKNPNPPRKRSAAKKTAASSKKSAAQTGRKKKSPAKSKGAAGKKKSTGRSAAKSAPKKKTKKKSRASSR